MSELLTGILVAGGIFGLMALKPEWFGGWIIKLLNTRLPKYANKISNVIAFKALDFAIYFFMAIPDNDVIKGLTEQLVEIKIQLEKELDK